MEDLMHYERLAALFDYPQRDYPGQVQSIHDMLESPYPLAAAQVEAFGKALPADGATFSPESLDEVQEIFTRSFDVQSITTLGVGYVMFGDDYKRGELLVNLNREHRVAGVDCGNELPDHLPNVLRLLARWEDREMVAEFVQEILHPALEQMIREFGSERMAERNRLYKKHFKTLIASSDDRATIFVDPLAAVVSVLKEDFSLFRRERPEEKSDFLRSVGRELDIEAREGQRPARSGRML